MAGRRCTVCHRLFLGPRFFDHGRQAVHGLRAEDHVHEIGPLDDGLPFLAGDTAAHADHEVFIGLFEVLPAAELGEDLFLGLFPHRAGVEQDDVRLAGVLGDGHAVGVDEDVHHFGGVIFVHLAAVGLDEELAGHGRSPGFCGAWDDSPL